MVFGNFEEIDGEGKIKKLITYKDWLSKPDKIAYIISNIIQTSCPLHRRQSIAQIGGFDENLSCGEERDVHIRLFFAGSRFFYHPTTVYKKRSSSDYSRISNASWFHDDPMRYIRMEHKVINMLKIVKNNYLTDEVRNRIAHRLWWRGRVALPHGCKAVANHHFDEARKIAPNSSVPLGLRYKLFYKLLGTYYTEMLYQLVGE